MDVRQALAAVFASVHIASPAPGAGSEERQRLLLDLRDTLYSRCFARPAGLPRAPATDNERSANGLVRKLSAANRGRDAWLPGWRVQEVGPEGTIVITEGIRRRTARAGDYALTFSEDLPPRPGCAVTLRHRKESLTLQAGVYYAFGDVLPEPGEEGGAVRIYLHAAQESAVPVFEILTSELNALQVPFTLKSMLRREDRDRSDATVLYLPARRFPVFAGMMKKVSVLLEPFLEPGVPLFTKTLQAGMGLAESPPTGESFGMSRCRLLAGGIVDAWMEGRQDVEARWRGVAQGFSSEGLSLARPYLNSGSADVYEVEAP